MEQAPQGTFQDELEWCILQLETVLLHLNPTPKQVGFLSAAEETRHILKILRSRKAAFVKKRQVMNHVFGDYRLKMAEERKRTEKAAIKPGKVQIQQEKAQASGSVVYKKRSGQTSESTTNWFTTSDNSFQFSFALPDMDPQATNGTLEEAQEQSDKQLWREVDWCVEQLELGLKTQKSTPKQAEEALHAIKTLRSDKAVLAKKCQVMRAMFGDYKKKMEEERQKQLKLMQEAAKSAQVVEVRENARRKSSQVFRKRSEASRKSPSSAGSPFHPPSHPE
ncbi:uncharacterized protein LOC119862959 isoform X2 [Dermochelys coriacea]|uniref:uncharacterized protein LOC119862959 isoform X2 n=1 Tax=Dermochelys coriacea TaxID=27794 RepID=UPI0018E74A01|nr:uncharacterized protein LOC119862959 isoform X2 [Dermochelys coriacea]